MFSHNQREVHYQRSNGGWMEAGMGPTLRSEQGEGKNRRGIHRKKRREDSEKEREKEWGCFTEKEGTFRGGVLQTTDKSAAEIDRARGDSWLV